MTVGGQKVERGGDGQQCESRHQGSGSEYAALGLLKFGHVMAPLAFERGHIPVAVRVTQ